jgi:hypothetical protein
MDGQRVTCQVDGVLVDCEFARSLARNHAVQVDPGSISASNASQLGLVPIYGKFGACVGNDCDWTTEITGYTSLGGALAMDVRLLQQQTTTSTEPLDWYDLSKILYDLKTKILSRGGYQEFLTKLLTKAQLPGDEAVTTNIIDLFQRLLLSGGFVKQGDLKKWHRLQ